MSTIDPSGAVHGSDGRFTGHIAAESVEDLPSTDAVALADLGLDPGQSEEIDPYDLTDASIDAARIQRDTDGTYRLEVDRYMDLTADGAISDSYLETRTTLVSAYAKAHWGADIDDSTTEWDNTRVTCSIPLDGAGDTSQVGQALLNDQSMLKFDDAYDDEQTIPDLGRYLGGIDNINRSMNDQLRARMDAVNPRATLARGNQEELNQELYEAVAALPPQAVSDLKTFGGPDLGKVYLDARFGTDVGENLPMRVRSQREIQQSLSDGVQDSIAAAADVQEREGDRIMHREKLREVVAGQPRLSISDAGDERVRIERR